MPLIFREMKVTDGVAVPSPDYLYGQVEHVERADGAYVKWLEYDCTPIKVAEIHLGVRT